MGWIEAVVLGLVQGLTEFLPISSSAHLRLTGELFGWEDPGAAFTAITQIGTEAAVLLYFRHDIARIVVAWLGSLAGKGRGDADARMGWLIIVGSIPIVVLGLLFQDDIETTLRDLRIVATALIVAPERETPGMSASDWANPMPMPSGVRSESRSRSSRPVRSAT